MVSLGDGSVLTRSEPTAAGMSVACRAFSCQTRGVCPSCNARRMVATAAHLPDQVLPPLPVRQWVLAVPKRLRCFLQRDANPQSAALRCARSGGWWSTACARPGVGARPEGPR